MLSTMIFVVDLLLFRLIKYLNTSSSKVEHIVFQNSGSKIGWIQKLSLEYF